MTFSQKILVGLAAGMAVGLFLGEMVGPLAVVADGFVKLLQMTVLPYVTVSIITSLGSINLTEAKSLGLRAGAVLVGVVGDRALLRVSVSARVSLGADRLVLLDLAAREAAAVRFHRPLHSVEPVHFAREQHRSGRGAVLGDPRALRSSASSARRCCSTCWASSAPRSSRATRFIVQLTPYGIFALAATAAGTLHLEQVERIQMYLITYIAISLLVSLWVLPGLIAAVTPIPYREVLGPTRDALITAFIAGDLFIVLPGLIESCKETPDALSRRRRRGRAACRTCSCRPRSTFRIPASCCR